MLRAGDNAAIPPGHRVYAVGDIHGCLDLLIELQTLIERDAAAAPEGHRTIVYLGDYVDRGPQSREVVDQLLKPLPGFEAVFLRGNHEDFLLQFIKPAGVSAYAAAWMLNGGDKTLASYGVRAVPHIADAAFLDDTRRAFLEVLPAEHLAFYQALRLTHRIGDYLFVHAGIRPGVPLEEQDENDLLWIRDEFLYSSADHGMVVVHGHTPVEAVEFRPNRINLDTGAIFGGRLTAVALHGTQAAFLDTGY